MRVHGKTAGLQGLDGVTPAQVQELRRKAGGDVANVVTAADKQYIPEPYGKKDKCFSYDYNNQFQRRIVRARASCQMCSLFAASLYIQFMEWLLAPPPHEERHPQLAVPSPDVADERPLTHEDMRVHDGYVRTPADEAALPMWRLDPAVTSARAEWMEKRVQPALAQRYCTSPDVRERLFGKRDFDARIGTACTDAKGCVLPKEYCESQTKGVLQNFVSRGLGDIFTVRKRRPLVCVALMQAYTRTAGVPLHHGLGGATVAHDIGRQEEAVRDEAHAVPPADAVQLLAALPRRGYSEP